jgi:hypothetical protein
MTNTDNAHNKKPLSDLSLWPGFCETLFLVLYKKSWYQFKFLLQDLLLMTKRAGLLFFFGKKDRIAPGEHQKEKKENVENVEKRIHPHLKKKISFLALFGPNQPKKKKNFFFFLLHPDDHAVRTRSSCSFSSASDGTPLFRGRRIISWKKDKAQGKKTIHEGEPKKKKKNQEEQRRSLVVVVDACSVAPANETWAISETAEGQKKEAEEWQRNRNRNRNRRRKKRRAREKKEQGKETTTLALQHFPRWLRWFYYTFQSILHSYLVPRNLWIFLMGLVKLDLVFLEEKIALLEQGLRGDCVPPSSRTDNQGRGKSEANVEKKGNDDGDVCLFFSASLRKKSVGSWILLPTLLRYLRFLEEEEEEEDVVPRGMYRSEERREKEWRENQRKEGWWRVAPFWANGIRIPSYYYYNYSSPLPMENRPYTPVVWHETSTFSGDESGVFSAIEKKNQETISSTWQTFLRCGHRLARLEKKKSTIHSCEGVVYFYWRGLWTTTTWTYFQPFYRPKKQPLSSSSSCHKRFSERITPRQALFQEKEEERTSLSALLFSNLCFFPSSFLPGQLPPPQLPQKVTPTQSEVFFPKTGGPRRPELHRLMRSLLLVRSSRLANKDREEEEKETVEEVVVVEEEERGKEKKGRSIEADEENNKKRTTKPTRASSVSSAVALFFLRNQPRTTLWRALPFFFCSRNLPASGPRGTRRRRKTGVSATHFFPTKREKKEALFFGSVPGFFSRVEEVRLEKTEITGFVLVLSLVSVFFLFFSSSFSFSSSLLPPSSPSPSPQEAVDLPIFTHFHPVREAFRNNSSFFSSSGVSLTTPDTVRLGKRPGSSFAFFSSTQSSHNQLDQINWFSRILLEREVTHRAHPKAERNEDLLPKKPSFFSKAVLPVLPSTNTTFSSKKKWKRLHFWGKSDSIRYWGGVNIFFLHEQDQPGLFPRFSPTARGK